MADASYSTAPKLSSATEGQAYAPISWVAVAAGLVALIYAVVFAALAVSSMIKRQPLIMGYLLVLPAVAFVLAFAARRHVRNSEGTRTSQLFNIDLVNFAWWVAVAGGLGYCAYLVAVEVAVRKDAESVFVDWAENLKKLDPSNPDDPGLTRAMHRTIVPAQQQLLSPTDAAGIRASHGETFVQLAQSDLVRICMRNSGNVTFRPGGLVDWVRETTRIQCTMTAEIESPEGVHLLQFRMMANITPSGERLWMIENKPAYAVSRRLTPLGRRIEELETAASVKGATFVQQLGVVKTLPNVAVQEADEIRAAFREQVYCDYIAQPNPPPVHTGIVPVSYRVAAAGGGSAVYPLAFDHEDSVINKLFHPIVIGSIPPDERKKRSDDARRSFASVWMTHRLARPGTMLQNTRDVFPVLLYDDAGKRLTCSIPTEILLPGGDSAGNTARGRVFLECTDPAIVSEITALRATSTVREASDILTPVLPDSKSRWRVYRIESDMRPVPQQQLTRDSMQPPERQKIDG